MALFLPILKLNVFFDWMFFNLIKEINRLRQETNKSLSR